MLIVSNQSQKVDPFGDMAIKSDVHGNSSYTGSHSKKMMIQKTKNKEKTMKQQYLLAKIAILEARLLVAQAEGDENLAKELLSEIIILEYLIN